MCPLFIGDRVFRAVPTLFAALVLVVGTRAQVINTIAGTGAFGIPGCGAFSGDGGPALEAELSEPFSILIDPNGDLIFSDGVNSRIRRIDNDGIITTIAGDSVRGYNGDGMPATLAHLAPFGITMGPDGAIYLADGGNNRIRRIGMDGIITTIAGTGQYSFSGDGGPALEATFRTPSNLVFDAEGNLIVADWYNNRIRRIGTDGIITTIAGNGPFGQGVGGFGGDGGPATEAQLFNPIGVVIGPEGALYISDFRNNRIRKVDVNGIITTVAGTGQAGFAGDMGPATLAKLNRPSGMVFSPAGELIFSDEVNLRIRKIDTDGTISTIAGSGVQGYTGDGGDALLAQVNDVVGMVFDADGNLILCDELNNRIRKIDFSVAAAIPPPPEAAASLVYPDPNDGRFTIGGEHRGAATVEIHDANGQLVAARAVQLPATMELTDVPDGLYVITVVSAEHVRTVQRFVVAR